MRVGITGFGSVWRRRLGKNAHDPERFRRAAYFNTTGVCVNGSVVRHRKIAGHVRFNGVGGFNAQYPLRMIGSVFECEEPYIWNGQNKVFFYRCLTRPEPPDYFLVAIRSQEFGLARVGEEGWKCESAFLISFSEWQDQQELLMLVPREGWVRTNVGRLALECDAVRSRSARLMLYGDGVEIH